MARPMPRLPPVTRLTFPCNSFIRCSPFFIVQFQYAQTPDLVKHSQIRTRTSVGEQVGYYPMKAPHNFSVECGGKRSAAPLWITLFRRGLSLLLANQSGAALRLP